MQLEKDIVKDLISKDCDDEIILDICGDEVLGLDLKLVREALAKKTTRSLELMSIKASTFLLSDFIPQVGLFRYNRRNPSSDNESFGVSLKKATLTAYHNILFNPLYIPIAIALYFAIK